ncbi:HPr(Ser) kinase/phosphatase [Candidatus Sumerlaeota bacterium]|nr:HPr(Ser) kinase/phosphatase [Candidatus Sumerlaeota bacterium]
MKRRLFTVRQLYNEYSSALQLELISGGEYMDRALTSVNSNRPALALAGFLDVFTFTRVQILGNTETSYLMRMSREERLQRLESLFEYEMPCVVLTCEEECPPEIYDVAARSTVPLFRSCISSSAFISRLTDSLWNVFAPRLSYHGVMIDVYGMGLMITGDSGVGKSETAIEMIQRGHRLVADDTVELHRTYDNHIIGKPSDLLRFHIEVRGMGIMDVERLFGITSVQLEQQLSVVVKLETRDPEASYERTGMEENKIRILDVELPHYTIPVEPGRNIAALLEVAALQQRLKDAGINSAKIFNDRIIALMKEPK